MKHSLVLFGLVFLILLSCSQRNSQGTKENNIFHDPTIRKIYSVADSRNASELLTFFSSDMASYRTSAVRCAASMPDSLFIEPLTKLMKDPIPYVRLHTAFAIGQYRDTLWLPVLERAIKKATIPEIKAEVLGAIGKCANRQAMEFLIYHEPNTPIEESGKLWGIYYATLKDLLEESDLRIIVAHLKSQERESRLAAGHILSRQKEFDLSDYRSEITEALLVETDGEIRAVILKSLGRTQLQENLLHQLISEDQDPRVRSLAIGMLPAPFSEKAKSLLINALEDGSVMVSMASARALSDQKLDSDELIQLRYLMETSEVPEVSAFIASELISHEGFSEEGWNYWKRLQPDDYRKIVMVGYLPASAIDTLHKYALLNSPIGTSSFDRLSSLIRDKGNQSTEWFQLANQAFRQELFAQTFLACSLLMDEKDYSGLDTNALLSYHEKLDSEGEAETRNTVQDLLDKMQVPYPSLPIQGHREINWEVVQSIKKSSSAIVHTSKGDFEMQLLVEDAPGSVSNFVEHAKRGFYDNTHFHRIVPVFVSQGGGPRGDGFGSSKHTIRSEFSNLQYGPGVVGLASAGKDTESCQFFITHTSTPHLNGRYTIFGAVTEGFDVLNYIHTGTSIDSVSIIQ